jgi:hypothetical protein
MNTVAAPIRGCPVGLSRLLTLAAVLAASVCSVPQAGTVWNR